MVQVKATNTFESKHAVIRKASYKQVKGVWKVVMVLDNGDLLFQSIDVINNASDFILDTGTLKLLAGGTIHYDVSVVKEGQNFVWSEGSDEVVKATKDLTLYNPSIITPSSEHTKTLIDMCVANIDAQEAWEAEIEATKARRELRRAEAAAEAETAVKL